MYAQVSGIGSNVKSKQFWYFLSIFVIVYLLDNKSLRLQIYICDVSSFTSVWYFIIEHWFVPNNIVLLSLLCFLYSCLFCLCLYLLCYFLMYTTLFSPLFNFSLWYTYLFICKSTPNLLCLWCGHLKQRFIQLSKISFPVLWIFTLWRNKKLSWVIMMWQFK